MNEDDPLGLDELSDDQLAEMARHVAAAIGRRDPATQAAAQSAVLDEAEKARIRRQAADDAEGAWIEALRKEHYERALEDARRRLVAGIEAEIARNPPRIPPKERADLIEATTREARLRSMGDARRSIKEEAARQARAALAGVQLIGSDERDRISRAAMEFERALMRNEEREKLIEQAKRRARA